MIVHAVYFWITGTHYLVADHSLGRSRLIEDEYLAGEEIGSPFSGRVLRAPDGGLRFMAFRNLGSDGEFIGEILVATRLNLGRRSIVGRRESVSR